jgi:hypothetical protein
MTERSDGPIPYRVEYSGRVRDGLKELIIRATERGLGPTLLAALTTLDRRLRIYPQFGQPLRDLSSEPGQEWLAVVSPLVIRYLLFEDRRLVSVITPIRPLYRSGL